MIDIHRELGNIDIYLLDQILRGRVHADMRILDAGCGAGRNLVYLLRSGCEVFGVDADPEAVQATRSLAASIAPGLSSDNFRVETVENMSFPDEFASFVISSAVLHFASSDAHFDAMLRGAWRVLRPGGVFFCRLATSIGIENQVRPIQGRHCLLPDGSQRYLMDENALTAYTDELNGELVDPLKTTLVQNQRSMTTWVLRKRV